MRQIDRTPPDGEVRAVNRRNRLHLLLHERVCELRPLVASNQQLAASSAYDPFT